MQPSPLIATVEMHRALGIVTFLFMLTFFTNFQMKKSQFLSDGIRHPAHISDELMHELAGDALKALHRQMSPDNVYKILSVNSITSQTAPGALYKLTMEVGVTGCKVAEVDIQSRGDCQLLAEADPIRCTFSIHERPWEKVKKTVNIEHCAYPNEERNEQHYYYIE